MSTPRVVSIGCPAGIGPEISVIAASRASEPVLLVGDVDVLRAAAKVCGVARERVVVVEDERALSKLAPHSIAVWGESARVSRPKPGAPRPEDGAAQLAWIDEALRLVVGGRASALVTGPVSKHAIASSGARGARAFRGHTEHLARRLGAPEVVMSFWMPELVTALVTTHLPLVRVPRSITAEAVASSAFWLGDFVQRMSEASAKRATRRARARIVVAALNPHAGEGGLLGHEEERAIGPGIELARERLAAARVAVDIDGPVGAETAFRRAKDGKYAGVVAMYHDQATIPHKLLGFGESVNVTLGLPIVRTSVDHGTAYDLAGTGRADARGMEQALRLAARMDEVYARSKISARAARRAAPAPGSGGRGPARAARSRAP